MSRSGPYPHRSGGLAARASKAGVAIALALAAAAWSALDTVPVAAHRVERGDLVQELMGAGTLEADLQAAVSPRFPGRLLRVLADEGQTVRSGDIVAELDGAELARLLEVDAANLSLARASLRRLEADTARARAVHVKNASDLERARRLHSRQALAASELDRSVESLRVAAAELSRASAAVAEGARRVEAAVAQLAVARERLSDTSLRAPFAGVVVRRERDPGDVVVPGSPVLTLSSTANMRCRVWLDETALTVVSPGQPARVVFRSDPGRSLAGSVLRLGREADRESREILVDVKLHELPANWAVGQRVEAFIRVAQRTGAVLLPENLLLRPGGGSAGTYVARGGRAVWRALTPGVHGPGAFEILSGLEPGELVVSPRDPSSQPLTDGRRISAP
ncbi:MAG: efflux RND transporter periplasmic adaptor subunit [Candidatus Wallbacteria bacterium]|nr:efflux RND transporter periplasmic adaptor subunit [Candidatus Wallbacteria bacterium]